MIPHPAGATLCSFLFFYQARNLAFAMNVPWEAGDLEYEKNEHGLDLEMISAWWRLRYPEAWKYLTDGLVHNKTWRMLVQVPSALQASSPFSQALLL